MSSLLLQPASGGKDIEVAWLDGRVTYEQEKILRDDDVEIGRIHEPFTEDLISSNLLDLLFRIVGFWQRLNVGANFLFGRS